MKNYLHKQITFCSLKNYYPEVYEEVIKKLRFPNYELFYNIDEAYENFIKKILAVIDWFDVKIMGKKLGDKLFKKFKKSYLHLTIRKQGTR